MIAAGVVLFAIGLSQTAAAPSHFHPWLGVFEAPPEKITISWTDGQLHLQTDNIGLPVDGRWHVTEPTFGVRQRATWLAEKSVITLDEQHNYQALEPGDESGWRYELRLDREGRALLKIVAQPDGSELLLRRFIRTREEKDS